MTLNKMVPKCLKIKRRGVRRLGGGGAHEEWGRANKPTNEQKKTNKQTKQRPLSLSAANLAIFFYGSHIYDMFQEIIHSNRYYE